ncbi:DUF4139 domain-containing protein [Yoonia sp. SS1-5]|uniref:DUF4139 domain-containing protein n=1 Tax=Yoonia rhodophyticola TaxID=3137370 RepID=A0AAN0NM42_9RHOB
MIISQEELERQNLQNFQAQTRGLSLEMAEEADMMAAPAVMAEAPAAMTADFSGATVTYRYPVKVDIRNGVDDLRLPLDTLRFDARVWAQAVPSRDQIAYRMVEFTNDGQEILLPGEALIFADGTMIGFSWLPLLAAGADTELGFGPLDGLRLTRRTPNRSEGDTGVFSSSNQLREAAVIEVENLTGQDWDVLLRDAIPFSEQDDLEVSFEATPNPARVAPDGKRGVLEWDLDVSAGATQTIQLDYTLRWPNGYVLR